MIISNVPHLIGVCIGALVLTGCPKDETTGQATATAAGGTDGDGLDAGTSSTSSSASDDGMGMTSDGTTMDFIPKSDVMGGSCDPWSQDCPSGEKCAAYNAGSNTWNANKCVIVMGTGKTGDPGMYDGAELGTDDCDVGYMCYYTNMEGAGTCVPLCTGTPDAPFCDEASNCSVSNDGSVLLCLDSCDPLLQD
jgi:hypothetical protein